MNELNVRDVKYSRDVNLQELEGYPRDKKQTIVIFDIKKNRQPNRFFSLPENFRELNGMVWFY